MSEAKEHVVEVKEASLAEVMRYMGGFERMQNFRDEWKELDAETKAFYKREVGKAIHG